MQIINFINELEINLPDNATSLISSACDAVIQIEEILDDTEINITFVNDEEIKLLNSQFRNIDKSTDVLSFPLGENGSFDINPENNALMLGDIVISVEHAIAQAAEFGHSVEREIAYLTVHSMLHLLGYDHIDEGVEKKIMRKKEEAALKIIGLDIKSED